MFFYESDFFILTVLNVFSKNQSPYMGLNEFFSNKNIPTLSKSKKKLGYQIFMKNIFYFFLKFFNRNYSHVKSFTQNICSVWVNYIS